MEIVRKKEDLSLPPVIEPYEIIPIINAAWDKSFGRVLKNKNTIAERGWWPYNRNLLLHPKIRVTMTDDEESKEAEQNIIFPTHCNLHYIDLTKKISTFDPSFIRIISPESTNKLKLNFTQGTALRCLDTIVQSNEIMETRNCIWSAQIRGKTLREELEAARGFTSGVVVKAKEHRLRLTVFDYVRESKEKKDEENHVALEKAAAYRTESLRKLKHVLVKNKPPKDWSIKDLTDIVRVVKTKDNGAMPKKRPELWALYLKCRCRSDDLIIYERIFDPTLADTPQDMPNPDVQENVRQPDIPCDDVPAHEKIVDPEQAVLEDNLQLQLVYSRCRTSY